MNRERWAKVKSPAILALKLSEEAAEVGTEITDAFHERGNEYLHQFTTETLGKMLTELEHVEFIAGLLKGRILDELGRSYHV